MFSLSTRRHGIVGSGSAFDPIPDQRRVLAELDDPHATTTGVGDEEPVAEAALAHETVRGKRDESMQLAAASDELAVTQLDLELPAAGRHTVAAHQAGPARRRHRLGRWIAGHDRSVRGHELPIFAGAPVDIGDPVLGFEALAEHGLL